VRAGCFWNIETDDDGVRAIQVVLEKKEIGHESWEALIEGDGPDTTFTNFVRPWRAFSLVTVQSVFVHCL
jgi:hypothetical protein